MVRSLCLASWAFRKKQSYSLKLFNNGENSKLSETHYKEIESFLFCMICCYHLVQNLTSSIYKPKNIKFKEEKCATLYVVLYVCESCFLKERAYHRR